MVDSVSGLNDLHRRPIGYCGRGKGYTAAFESGVGVAEMGELEFDAEVAEQGGLERVAGFESSSGVLGGFGAVVGSVGAPGSVEER